MATNYLSTTHPLPSPPRSFIGGAEQNMKPAWQGRRRPDRDGHTITALPAYCLAARVRSRTSSLDFISSSLALRTSCPKQSKRARSVKSELEGVRGKEEEPWDPTLFPSNDSPSPSYGLWGRESSWRKLVEECNLGLLPSHAIRSVWPAIL